MLSKFFLNKRVALVVLGQVIGLALLPSIVRAQTIGSTIAQNLVVSDTQITAGDIVVESPNGIQRAQTPYTNKMIGVAVDNPMIALHDQTNATRSIVSSGTAVVKVNNSTGQIHRGDFVTSSGTPGVGMKALNAGYVIGIAANDAQQGSNGFQSVTVAVDIHYAASNQADLANPILRLITGLTTSLNDPSRISLLVRYMVGAFIAFMAFVMGMYLFGRSIRTGIEAIGRNPLARSSIQFSILLNLLLTAIVSLAGIVAAFIIIRF